LNYLRDWHFKAVNYFKEKGVDLSGYNTIESADDLNDLRIALGEKKLNLLGLSYGTHLALVAIRRHAPNISSAVLAGTEGLNQTYKLPSTYDAQLYKLSYLSKQNPDTRNKINNLVVLYKKVIAKLEKEPVIVPVQNRKTGKTMRVPIGKFGFQIIVRMDIGDGNDFSVFPRLFDTVYNNDISVLRKYVEKRYNQFSSGISVMGTIMDFYSGTSQDRYERIKKEAGNALLGNVMNFPGMYIADIYDYPDLCDEYRSPFCSDTRTLFISGTMDSNTPPYQAEQVRWDFPGSTHIIVDYAGHEDTLPDKRVQEAIVKFFIGEDVSGLNINKEYGVKYP